MLSFYLEDVSVYLFTHLRLVEVKNDFRHDCIRIQNSLEPVWNIHFLLVHCQKDSGDYGIYIHTGSMGWPNTAWLVFHKRFLNFSFGPRRYFFSLTKSQSTPWLHYQRESLLLSSEYSAKWSGLARGGCWLCVSDGISMHLVNLGPKHPQS